MATNHTQNYQLNLWEPTDRFLREEFNENFEDIEAALVGHDAALANLLNGKADKAAVTALSQTVSGKADASTVTALTQTVNGKATTAALNALTQTVNGKADTSSVTALAGQVTALAAKYGPDNLPWVTGTYTGMGENIGDIKEITLGFRPTLLIVVGDNASYGLGVTHNGTSKSLGMYSTSVGTEPHENELILTATGFQAKKCLRDGTTLNYKGWVYVYFALR